MMTIPGNAPSPQSWVAGTHGEYRWISTTDYGIDDLLAACPSVLLEKYVAVTSCDSGPLRLSEEDQARGWQLRGAIAYSPHITSPNVFPYHEHFDEWYVFPEAVELGTILEGNPFDSEVTPRRVEVFVNYYLRMEEPDMRDLVFRLWRQLEWMRAESYIAEADWGYLTLITRDENLFAAVCLDVANRKAEK